MAVFSQIILKYGSGDPSIYLGFAEPAFDASHNILWIGKTDPSIAIPFYPFKSVLESSLGAGFLWSGGTLTVNASVAGVSPAYVDGSFAYRDTSIQNVWTKLGYVDTSLNALALKTSVNSSTNALWLQINRLDASITNVDVSINDVWLVLNTKASSTNVNASTNAIWVKLGNIDTSLSFLASNTALNYLSMQVWEQLNRLDASIVNIDISINDIWTKLDACLGSGGTGDVTKAYVDGSLAYRDSSITDIWTKFQDVDSSLQLIVIPDVNLAYVDGSLAYRDSSITDIWTKLGYVDTSLNNIQGGDVNKAYVDGSLAYRDVSIAEIWNNSVEASTLFYTKSQTDASFALKANVDSSLSDVWIKLDACLGSGVGDVTKAYVDGSLAYRDVSIADIWNNSVEASTLFYTKTEVDSSFALKVDVNSSLNELYVYLDSSLAFRDTSINDLRIYLDASLNAKINMSVATDTHFSTGFVNRTDSSLSFNNSNRVFTIHAGNGYYVYNNAVKTYKDADASIQIADSVGIHYIFYDVNAEMQMITSEWTITSGNAPIATVYWDGSYGALSDERHGAGRNVDWHQWAHDTIGVRYESGLAGTFTDVSTHFDQGNIHDEDLDMDIPALDNDVRIWYRNAALSAMKFDENVSAITAKVVGSDLMYDNAGTLTAVGLNGFVKNYIYATTDVSHNIMCVLSQSTATTIANARLIGAPSMPNVVTPEIKLIYTVIWKNQGGTPTFVESTDYRTSSSLPGAGTPTLQASAITSVPSGTISATNVQAALDELDSEKISFTAFNSSMGAVYTKTQVDSSFAYKVDVNSSINGLYSNIRIDASFALKVDVNSSTNAIYVKFGNVDTSLNNLGIKNSYQDASINSMYSNVRIDASFAIKRGFNIISVSTNAPASPGWGDLWIDTSI